MKIFFDIVKFEAILGDDFGEKSLLKYVNEPDLTHIPPLKRRRLSKSAKALFACLGKFDLENTPIVFSSAKGEVNRCFDLLKELALNEPVSPTSFSLSVHNAMGSQYSIHSKNSCEISAISAKNSLEYALLDGYMKLSNEVSQVLVVSHCEGIRQEFMNEEGSSLLAVLIKRGSSFSLAHVIRDSKYNRKNSNIEFLKNYEKLPFWDMEDENFTWRLKHEKN